MAGGKYEEVFLGFWFIKQFEKEFSKDTFIKLSSWLENGICNWAQTDDSAVDIVSPFLINKIVEIGRLSMWRYSSSKWMRRSVAVSLIKPGQQGLSVKAILDFIAPLMNDTEKVVHQGAGLVIKRSLEAASCKKWKPSCWNGKTPARVLIIQYATEKMTADQKNSI